MGITMNGNAYRNTDRNGPDPWGYGTSPQVQPPPTKVLLDGYKDSSLNGPADQRERYNPVSVPDTRPELHVTADVTYS